MGNLSDSLGSLVPKRSDAQTPKRANAQAAKRPELPLQGTAMSRHPDFVKKTLYVRASTSREAMRRYEDEGGKTESERVQMRVERYAGVRHA